MKFHPSIVALGRAIYAIREVKGQPFDHTLAVFVLGHNGFIDCVQSLDQKMRATRPGAGVAYHAGLFGHMVSMEMCKTTRAVLDAYRRAMPHFPTFTDLFGLAADWLYAKKGVDIRDYFAGPALFKRAVDVAVEKFERGELDLDRAMVVNGDRLGSSALGLISAVRKVGGADKLADTDFILLCSDPWDMLLAITQISAWLKEKPDAIRSIVFTAQPQGGTCVLRIGEVPRCATGDLKLQEAA